MAIQVDVTTPSGIEVKGAYCRVCEVSITKSYVVFTLQQFADAKKAPFAERRMSAAYELNGPNPYVQAYDHIKSMPEFVGAMDC